MSQKNQVKVYSAKWCGNCPTYKEMLTKAGVEFESIDVDEVKGATTEMFKYGFRGLPATLVTDPEGNMLYAGVGSDVSLVKKFL